MVICLCPTLIGLMTAVGVLRASGFLDFCGEFWEVLRKRQECLRRLFRWQLFGFFRPVEQTGLLLDIFKEFGTDSLQGFMGGILLGSTESVFYCMSVYFGSVQIEKTRYRTLAGVFDCVICGNRRICDSGAFVDLKKKYQIKKKIRGLNKSLIFLSISFMMFCAKLQDGADLFLTET